MSSQYRFIHVKILTQCSYRMEEGDDDFGPRSAEILITITRKSDGEPARHSERSGQRTAVLDGNAGTAAESTKCVDRHLLD